MKRKPITITIGPDVEVYCFDRLMPREIQFEVTLTGMGTRGHGVGPTHSTALRRARRDLAKNAALEGNEA